MKKGFTLVELLAVITILGILSLITIISIGPILKDSEDGLSDIQKNNIEESASLYYVKHRIGIDDYELDNPRDCIDVSELIESGYIDSDEVINPKTREEILGSVKVTYKSNNYIYEYQDNACTNYDKGIICERVESTEVGNVPEGEFVAGDAYNCKVDPDKSSYKFYILSGSDENSDIVNLIMDQNINSDGTPAGMTIISKNGNDIYNITSWTDESDIGVGPVTAMNFLYNATKTWINIAPLTYTYMDSVPYGYKSFMSTNGIATITPLEGSATTIGTTSEPLRARMPVYSSIVEYVDDSINKINEKGEVSDKKTDNSNEYLYENMSKEVGGYYWTLSSSNQDHLTYNFWFVGYGDGILFGEDFSNGVVDCMNYTGYSGVRPVISVYKFQME